MILDIVLFELLGVILPIALLLSSKSNRTSPGAATIVSALSFAVGTIAAIVFGYFEMPPLAYPFGDFSIDLMFVIAISGGLFFIATEVTDGMIIKTLAVYGTLIIFIAGNVSIGWDVISSKSFVDIAGQVTVHEEGDVNITDVTHPLLVTREQAIRKANAVANEFGDETNLISLEHPTLGDDANWYVVAEVPGFFRWKQLLERGGMPGYIKISADDPGAKAEVVILPEGGRIKYSPYSFFGHNSRRMIREMNHGATFYKTYFHINGTTGAPEFVFSVGKPKLGYHIPVPEQLVVQNAITGELKSYDIGTQPAEYQFVYPIGMLMDRVDSWGAYRFGWKAHAFGGANLEHVATYGLDTREGWPVIQDGHVKYYLPMQWRNSTGNIQGFMIADAATSALDLYMQGATNPEQVRLKLDSIIPQKARGNWEAAEPKEYSLGGGLKVWAAPYETTSTVGKSFQGVGVTDLDADIAAYGESLDKAIEAIRQKMLGSEKFRSALAVEQSQTLTIAQLTSRVEEGNTVYYFTAKELPGNVFRSSGKTPPFIAEGVVINVNYLVVEGDELVETIAIELAH